MSPPAAPELANAVRELLRGAHAHDDRDAAQGRLAADQRHRVASARTNCGSAGCRALRRATCSATRASRCTRAPATRGWPGDAKLAGLAEEITDLDAVALALGTENPPEPMHLFRADVREVVITKVPGTPADHLLIESWHAGRGLESVKR